MNMRRDETRRNETRRPGVQRWSVAQGAVVSVGVLCWARTSIQGETPPARMTCKGKPLHPAQAETARLTRGIYFRRITHHFSHHHHLRATTRPPRPLGSRHCYRRPGLAFDSATSSTPHLPTRSPACPALTTRGRPTTSSTVVPRELSRSVLVADEAASELR